MCPVWDTFSFGGRTGTIFEKVQSWRLLCLRRPVELHEWDAGFGEEFFGESVGIVAAVDDAFDADADEDAGAEAAWAVGAVEGGAGDGDAHDGGLDDGVLLGVEGAAVFVAFAGAEAHALAGAAAEVGAVGHAGGCAVVAGGDDAVVFDEDGADLAAQAVGAFGDDVGDFHEIGVPVWALVHGEGLLYWWEIFLSFFFHGSMCGGEMQSLWEIVLGWWSRGGGYAIMRKNKRICYD